MRNLHFTNPPQDNQSFSTRFDERKVSLGQGLFWFSTKRKRPYIFIKAYKNLSTLFFVDFCLDNGGHFKNRQGHPLGIVMKYLTVLSDYHPIFENTKKNNCQETKEVNVIQKCCIK